MPEITLFCEDSFHEKFVGAMLTRFAKDYGVGVKSRFLSATGGLSRMHNEFERFLRDIPRPQTQLPDAIIVVVDANCQGHNARRGLMEGALARYPQLKPLVSYAIPDPHIERWMLVDPMAFQTVFGRGCTLPAVKCAKDKYKKLLRAEIRQSGIDAPLGGEEFAEDIVMKMDLGHAEVSEPSLGLFLKGLKGRFNGWKAHE
jgi:hypothetical protein